MIIILIHYNCIPVHVKTVTNPFLVALMHAKIASGHDQFKSIDKSDSYWVVPVKTELNIEIKLFGPFLIVNYLNKVLDYMQLGWFQLLL